MEDDFIIDQDRGVIADGGNRIVLAHQHQLVAKSWCRAKTRGEYLAPLHLMLSPKLSPERRISRSETRIGHAADAIDRETRQAERSGARVASGEIRSVGKQRRRHHSIRGFVSPGIKPGSTIEEKLHPLAESDVADLIER